MGGAVIVVPQGGGQARAGVKVAGREGHEEVGGMEGDDRKLQGPGEGRGGGGT